MCIRALFREMTSSRGQIMLRMMKLAFVVVLVAMAADAQAAPIRVAVEDGTGRGGGAAAVVQLNNDTFFDFSAT